MQTLQLDITKKYSYSDYLTWFDERRMELYDGFVKLMTPAPSRLHQKSSVILSRDISVFLKNKKCQIYYAPFDVRLPSNGEKDNSKIFTVVQPDICVICDESKLDDKGCIGAPDFIVEIVSKGNVDRDVKDKFRLYEKHKVKEYWIVFPLENVLQVFLLDKVGKYKLDGIYTAEDKVKVNIFKGELVIDLKEIFKN